MRDESSFITEQEILEALPGVCTEDWDWIEDPEPDLE